MNDGDVNHADNGENGGEAVGLVALLNARLQQHISEVQKEQNQLGSEARVPRPERAPGGLAPNRTGGQGDGGHQCAIRGGGAGKKGGDAAAPDKKQQRRHGEHHINAH